MLISISRYFVLCTATGFSGTLFENSLTREPVLSFRSTEFLDDAVRGNTATNMLEIDGTGFAWVKLTTCKNGSPTCKMVGSLTRH